MRSKYTLYNFLAAIIELLAVTLSSFIVPHYIIHFYGSNVNGLIASITQFLSYIALIESGIGAIGRSSLYRPLAEKDDESLNGNINALEGFYRKVACIFVGYALLLASFYPFLVNQDFNWFYSASLVLILAVSTFTQYYFGITYQTLIQADQKKYFVSLLQAIIIILNMIVIIIMIRLGVSIHYVQLSSALVFAIRPFVFYIYAHKKYRINKTIKPNTAILKQRWDGLAQHIAFFIHKNTDVVVLTVLTNVRVVSIYSVYMLPIAGCSKVVNIFSSSLEPAFGNMIAKGEINTLKKRVTTCSTIIIQIAVLLFSTTAIIITPFIQIYTKGVSDIDYLNPTFGIIMLIAEAFYCIRMPFQAAVYAAGHFKETRNGAIIEAVINIIVSVIFVFRFGLLGVSLGTLVAMCFRTVQYMWYYYSRLVNNKSGLIIELKRLVITLIELMAIIAFSKIIPSVSAVSFSEWLWQSCLVGCGCFIIVTIISLIFYKDDSIELVRFFKRIIHS